MIRKPISFKIGEAEHDEGGQLGGSVQDRTIDNRLPYLYLVNFVISKDAFVSNRSSGFF